MKNHASYHPQGRTLTVLLFGADFNEAVGREMVTVANRGCDALALGDSLNLVGARPKEDMQLFVIDRLTPYQTPEGSFLSVFFVPKKVVS